MNLFIAFTGRSGSSLLCDLLRRTDKLGRPLEHFCVDSNGWFKPNPTWKSKTWLAHYHEYEHHTRTENGVTGAKVSWEQWRALRVGLGHPPAVHRWVWLRRHDKLRQAISAYKTLRTGAVELRGDGSLPSDPLFAAAAILSIAMSLVDEDALWAGYLAGKSALELCYEDWIDEPNAAVQKIAEFCGTGPVDVATSDHRKMANEVSEAWYYDLLPRWRTIAG